MNSRTAWKALFPPPGPPQTNLPVGSIALAKYPQKVEAIVSRLDMSPHPEQPLPISARSRPSSGGWVGLCAALVLPAAASAQQVLAPPPAEFAARPPADPLAAPGEEEPGAITSALGTGEGALQWMVSHLHPRILYRFLYGDGIQSLPGVQEQTAIHEIYPGISLNIGKNEALGKRRPSGSTRATASRTPLISHCPSVGTPSIATGLSL